MSDEAQNLNFDETLSENRRAPNLLSIPSRSKFHLATKRAIDYHEVVRADGAVDCVFPSVILENAFKFARVKEITAGLGYREMMTPTRCLSIEWMREALALLMDNGRGGECLGGCGRGALHYTLSST